MVGRGSKSCQNPIRRAPGESICLHSVCISSDVKSVILWKKIRWKSLTSIHHLCNQVILWNAPFSLSGFNTSLYMAKKCDVNGDFVLQQTRMIMIRNCARYSEWLRNGEKMSTFPIKNYLKKSTYLAPALKPVCWVWHHILPLNYFSNQRSSFKVFLWHGWP